MEFAFFKEVYDPSSQLNGLKALNYLLFQISTVRKCHSDSANISSSPLWYFSRQNCPLPLWTGNLWYQDVSFFFFFFKRGEKSIWTYTKWIPDWPPMSVQKVNEESTSLPLWTNQVRYYYIYSESSWWYQ